MQDLEGDAPVVNMTLGRLNWMARAFLRQTTPVAAAGIRIHIRRDGSPICERNSGFAASMKWEIPTPLAVLAQTQPDLVLADVRMPGTSGLELLRLIRERSPETDVVLMTAFDDLVTVAEAMREGARDFLVKPLDLHHISTVKRASTSFLLVKRRSRATSYGPIRCTRDAERFPLVGRRDFSRAILSRARQPTRLL